MIQILLSFALIASAPAAADAKARPSWLETEIQKHFPDGKATKINPPSAKAVYQYSYKGRKVYYIPARCCDRPSFLLDSNGRFLCNPDGGMTGKGDGFCKDFFDSRKSEKLVWPD